MSATGLLIAAAVFAFILQFFDASVGMGFGEITALLLILGFAPIETIPAVILASAVLSLFASFLHHDFRNVDLSHDSPSLKVALILTGFGVVGITLGALVAINLPEFILKLYIGLLVSIIGITLIINHAKKREFSWGGLISLGSLAAFNKGISGGGYGPVLAGGQILSGVQAKKAVGITSLAEGLVSIAGVAAFFFISNNFNWLLILALIAGGAVATPIAAYAVNKIEPKTLRKYVGVVSLFLGLALVARAFI